MLDNDSYYLRYFVNSIGEETAYICHYKEVWENGFTSESYTIEDNYMEFEDASWNGLNLSKQNFGTRILRTHYNRWEEIFNMCRLNIERTVLSAAKPYDKDFQEGDYIYVDYKGILSDEEDGYGGKDIPDEQKYDGPDLLLLHILKQSSNNIEISEIIIDEYDIRIKENSSFDMSDYIDEINHLYYITKETYDKSLDIINRTYKELMSDMKKRVLNIETIH